LPGDSGNLDAGRYGGDNDEAFHYSIRGQTWRQAASAGYGVLDHL